MLNHWRWKIQHVELSGKLPDLSSQPECDGIFVVFWWHHIPLGYQEILAQQLPVPASQLVTIAVQTIAPTVGDHLFAHGFKASLPGISTTLLSRPDRPPNFQALMALKTPLAELEQRWAHVQDSIMEESVSVVICTRDRPQQLEKCLRSLQQLSHPADEILVVDNAPTSNATQHLVEQMPTVRYVVEPRPGLSVARNTGIRCAKGSIIVFTDDDVEVHTDWIARLRYGFQDPNVMVVTGLMLPAELETEAQVAFHRGTSGFKWECRPLVFDSHYFEAKKPFGVPVWQIGAGANMALRRKVVELVGDFDERLGAGASGCSEDSEFWYRVLAAGWLCRYEPTAVIYHYHRRTMDALKQQMYAYMRGHVAALLIQTTKLHHLGNLSRLLVSLPKYYARLIVRGIISGFHGRYRTIAVELLGCLSGIRFFLRHWSTPATEVGSMYKKPLNDFLACNPFSRPFTQGFFYREKMRAIHAIAPDRPLQNILEIGGGQGGLTALLYPQAQITNLDLDPQFAQAACNQQSNVQFVRGDATRLPFADACFDAVTLFDVLEHIPDDRKAASEALRVLKPGGFLLISTPNENWRFPYYPIMQPICPTDADVMAAWGHVRRGYTLAELTTLIGLPCQKSATFINPLTVLCHDIAFSKLPALLRELLCLLLSPMTWPSYWLHQPQAQGTETAAAWEKQMTKQSEYARSQASCLSH